MNTSGGITEETETGLTRDRNADANDVSARLVPVRNEFTRSAVFGVRFVAGEAEKRTPFLVPKGFSGHRTCASLYYPTRISVF